VHPPKKERRGKENLFSHPPSASPEASPGYQVDFQADPSENLSIVSIERK